MVEMADIVRWWVWPPQPRAFMLEMMTQFVSYLFSEKKKLGFLKLTIDRRKTSASLTFFLLSDIEVVFFFCQNQIST